VARQAGIAAGGRDPQVACNLVQSNTGHKRRRRKKHEKMEIWENWAIHLSDVMCVVFSNV